MAVARFGGLVKHIAPVKLSTDGLVLRTVNRHYALPDGSFSTVLKNWKTENAEINSKYQMIESSADVHTYQVVWDEEWNCYRDTGELEKNGKKLAYAGEITTGVKNQMREIAVVIFDYGNSADRGSEIFHIFTEQYVKP